MNADEHPATVHMAATALRQKRKLLPGESSVLATVRPMNPQRLLRLAVEARIEAWEHPLIEERDEAAGEVGVMLQEVVRDDVPDAIPAFASLDGLKEFTARTDGGTQLYVLGAFYLLADNQDSMLPVEADLDIASGARSVVRVGSEASVFPMPTSERQFARHMENVEWRHRVVLTLADAA